ncbi:ADP-ribosylglycohydrolase family protein [Nocardia tengchongensis]|uniref:ADP-ribosylglycohydrolase family protein n=1 Tax=Nocardia tengchongensis TaxID=2055889 RepID=UPI0036A78CD2
MDVMIEAAHFGHHEADPRALLYYEWCQRVESGYAVADFEEEVHELARTDRPVPAACWRLLDKIERAPRLADWPYTEWRDAPDIGNVAASEQDSATLPDRELLDRIHGGWLGRRLGRTTDHEVDYAVLGLHLLERRGLDFDPDDVAAEWLERLPFLQTYTAERVAYRNLIDGFAPPDTATYRNPYREWIGALARADIHGYTHPGRPRRAAAAAARDASISHTGNGSWAAMWAAALIAAAFTDPTPAAALATAATVIPARSRLAVALSEVLADHARGDSWEQAATAIHTRHAHYNRLHAIGNACLIAAGLLWGEGDFTRTVELAAQGGWDADANAAIAGSVSGIRVGAAGIRAARTAPFHLVAGAEGTRIHDFASRTARLVG